MKKYDHFMDTLYLMDVEHCSTMRGNLGGGLSVDSGVAQLYLPYATRTKPRKASEKTPVLSQ